jgi:hypothetical protein
MEGDPEAVVVGAIDGATEGGGGVEAGVEAGGESKLTMTPAAASAEAIECARYGEPDELSQMMAAGADVDHKGSGGNTALHMVSGDTLVSALFLLAFVPVVGIPVPFSHLPSLTHPHCLTSPTSPQHPTSPHPPHSTRTHACTRRCIGLRKRPCGMRAVAARRRGTADSE